MYNNRTDDEVMEDVSPTQRLTPETLSALDSFASDEEGVDGTSSPRFKKRGNPKGGFCASFSPDARTETTSATGYQLSGLTGLTGLKLKSSKARREHNMYDDDDDNNNHTTYNNNNSSILDTKMMEVNQNTDNGKTRCCLADNNNPSLIDMSTRLLGRTVVPPVAVSLSRHRKSAHQRAEEAFADLINYLSSDSEDDDEEEEEQVVIHLSDNNNDEILKSEYSSSSSQHNNNNNNNNMTYNKESKTKVDFFSTRKNHDECDQDEPHPELEEGEISEPRSVWRETTAEFNDKNSSSSTIMMMKMMKHNHNNKNNNRRGVHAADGFLSDGSNESTMGVVNAKINLMGESSCSSRRIPANHYWRDVFLSNKISKKNDRNNEKQTDNNSNNNNLLSIIPFYAKIPICEEDFFDNNTTPPGFSSNRKSTNRFRRRASRKLRNARRVSHWEACHCPDDNNKIGLEDNNNNNTNNNNHNNNHNNSNNIHKKSKWRGAGASSKRRGSKFPERTSKRRNDNNNISRKQYNNNNNTNGGKHHSSSNNSSSNRECLPIDSDTGCCQVPIDYCNTYNSSNNSKKRFIRRKKNPKGDSKLENNNDASNDTGSIPNRCVFLEPDQVILPCKPDSDRRSNNNYRKSDITINYPKNKTNKTNNNNNNNNNSKSPADIIPSESSQRLSDRYCNYYYQGANLAIAKLKKKTTLDYRKENTS